MFKTWQIFVFSLIPLALVFAGVFIGSIHGSDSEREVFPTPAPAATPRSLAAPGLDATLDVTASRRSQESASSISWSTALTMNDQDVSARESRALIGVAQHAAPLRSTAQDYQPYLRG
jgi:hypothetical protein